MFGEDHGFMAKYYTFISIQESVEEKTDALSELRPKIF